MTVGANGGVGAYFDGSQDNEKGAVARFMEPISQTEAMLNKLFDDTNTVGGAKDGLDLSGLVSGGSSKQKEAGLSL